MRELNVDIITQNIKEMCIEANHFLTDDMKKVFKNAVATEESPLGKKVLKIGKFLTSSTRILI